MTHSTVHYSSASDNWATPQYFFDALDAEFKFTLDACADAENHKCARYFSAADDGLSQQWAPATVWLNPPYGRAIGRWVQKAFDEWTAGATVVCLVPARTDTRWWHDYAMSAQIRFVRGRLKFGGCASNAPFPNAVLIFAR